MFALRGGGGGEYVSRILRGGACCAVAGLPNFVVGSLRSVAVRGIGRGAGRARAPDSESRFGASAR